MVANATVTVLMLMLGSKHELYYGHTTHTLNVIENAGYFTGALTVELPLLVYQIFTSMTASYLKF